MKNALDFTKNKNGLIPAVVQDATTKDVLMLGFMDESAWTKTQTEKKVTFYSRTKGRLWTKGEESGHYLDVIEIRVDCDRDTVLILAKPHGPVCHTGSETCFGDRHKDDLSFLKELESVIDARREAGETTSSYVATLFKSGISKIAQKVGEEAVELVLEAKDGSPSDFAEEAADLLFHYLVLLKARDMDLNQVSEVLRKRHKQER